ncbi:MAG: hypothetical protein ACOX6T_11255 [Myxococcales bacterium]|jgi:Cys-rich repeat protein
MNLNAAYRLAVITALGLGVSGFGPGSCGPGLGLEPEPVMCEGLSEEVCIAIEGCAPMYFQDLCACAPCAREDGACPPCNCGGPEYAGCGVQQPDPPPTHKPSPCENLDERSCIEHPACRPVYFGPEPGACCGSDGRCLGAYAGCVDGPMPPPPPPCEVLGERACLDRADCEPVYDRCADGERCGGSFAGCRTACSPVACALWCPNGFARDARGCEICACAEGGCSSDRDCAPGERCVFPVYEAGDEGMPAPQGVCRPGPRECRADSDCAAGERCVLPICWPGADCDGGVGYCEPVPVECRTDAECAAGEVCRQDPTHPCSWGPCLMHELAPPMLCLPACSSLDERACGQRPDCRGIYGSACDASGNCTPDREFRCEDAREVCEPVLCDMWCPNGFQRDERGCEICACNPGCRSDAECAAGEVCRQDPTHPCSWGPCPMHELAPPMLCLPACSSLDERACGQRPDCRGVYGSACDPSGNCTPDREFRCEDANGACEPVLCDMWCPTGFQRDERGCEICACNPGCGSDADCGPGERCEAGVETCDAAGNCQVSEGVCRPAGCFTDAECGPGMACLGCPPNALCELPGFCAPQGACWSDADCAAGESCIFLMYGCMDENGLGCSWGYGICNRVDRGCADDSDCAAGERCEMADCSQSADCSPYETCVPVTECSSDADCGPDRVCELYDSCTALGCPPSGGVCRDLRCEGLDEASCLRSPSCSARYVPSGQEGRMVFESCQPL